MESQVEVVKQKTDIVEVIGSYIRLDRAGRNFKGLCPFHGERTPSFMVSPERGTWRCFGCGEHGDVISFLEKHDGLSFMEALEQLAAKAGVTLVKDPHQQRQQKTKQRLYELLNLSAEYFSYLLNEHAMGDKARQYLASRQIPMELAERYRLGYAPASWQSLADFLTKKGFTKQEMMEAGMLSQNERGRSYDRFRDRLMFTVCDGMGRVVGFSGRSLSDDAVEAKYLNSPETPVFHKSGLLFGLSVAKEQIRQRKRVVLVEGNVDVLSSARAGVAEVVAPLGTALTEDQVKLLARYTETVYMAFDADRAGQEAVVKSIRLLREGDLAVKVVRLPEGSDPDEFIRQKPEAWKAQVDGAVEVFDFYVERIKKSYDLRSERGLQQAVAELLPVFLVSVTNRDKESLLYSRMATVLGVEERVLRGIARRLKQGAYAAGSGIKESKETALNSVKVDKKETKKGPLEAKVDYLLAGLLSLPLSELSEGDLSFMAELLPGSMESQVELMAGWQRLTEAGQGWSVSNWAKDLSAEGLAELDRLESMVGEPSLTDGGTISVVVISGDTSLGDRLAELRQVVREINRLYLKKQLDTLSRSLRLTSLDSQQALELQQQHVAISQQLAELLKRN